MAARMIEVRPVWEPPLRREFWKCQITQDIRTDSPIAVNTSFGVWHPRYILENPIRRKIKQQKILPQIFLLFSASGKNRQTALCVCPLGKE